VRTGTFRKTSSANINLTGMKRLVIVALFSLSFSTLGVTPRAHVLLLTPVGGEMFMPGDEVAVTWQPIQIHNQIDWDLYYSDDGGATYVLVVGGIPSNAVSTIWTVSKTTGPTFSGRLKIVQDNVVLDYESESLNFSILGTSVATEDQPELPAQPALVDAYPNPFSTEATVSFSTVVSDNVRISVYDVQGREVTVLTDRVFSPGSHEVKWLPINNPAGTYFVRMTAAGVSSTRTLILNN
jgi:Secretion system C-terminal sorting domain